VDDSDGKRQLAPCASKGAEAHAIVGWIISPSSPTNAEKTVSSNEMLGFHVRTTARRFSFPGRVALQDCKSWRSRGETSIPDGGVVRIISVCSERPSGLCCQVTRAESIRLGMRRTGHAAGAGNLFFFDPVARGSRSTSPRSETVEGQGLVRSRRAPIWGASVSGPRKMSSTRACAGRFLETRLGRSQDEKRSDEGRVSGPTGAIRHPRLPSRQARQ